MFSNEKVRRRHPFTNQLIITTNGDSHHLRISIISRHFLLKSSAIVWELNSCVSSYDVRGCWKTTHVLHYLWHSQQPHSNLACRNEYWREWASQPTRKTRSSHTDNVHHQKPSFRGVSGGSCPSCPASAKQPDVSHFYGMEIQESCCGHSSQLTMANRAITTWVSIGTCARRSPCAEIIITDGHGKYGYCHLGRLNGRITANKICVPGNRKRVLGRFMCPNQRYYPVIMDSLNQAGLFIAHSIAVRTIQWMVGQQILFYLRMNIIPRAPALDKQ